MSEFQTGLARWETRSERQIADCRIFQLASRTCYHPGRDVESEFSILHTPNWVQAIPLTPERKIVMVNQFRFGRDGFSWEMPGGLQDKGEDPIAGALRELEEETGYTGENPRIIATVSPNPAIQTNTLNYVFVENCKADSSQSWDTHEDLEIGVFSLDEIQEMTRDGRIHNAMTFNALYFLERELNHDHKLP